MAVPPGRRCRPASAASMPSWRSSSQSIAAIPDRGARERRLLARSLFPV